MSLSFGQPDLKAMAYRTQEDFENEENMRASKAAGFSPDFFNYLRKAREKKLTQAEADITRTGVETERTKAETGKTLEETKIVPIQGELMQANIRKTGAETETEYGRTDPARSAMARTQAEIDTAYGRTAPAQASMRLQLAQAGKYQSETPFSSPFFSNSMVGSTGGIGGAAASPFNQTPQRLPKTTSAQIPQLKQNYLQRYFR